MSTFEDDRYHWRETYFILFDPKYRPALESVRHQLLTQFPSLKTRTEQANTQGQLEILSIQAPEDFSAIDIIYQEGEHVLSEITALADQLEQTNTSLKSQAKLKQVRRYSARLDLLHFEQLEEVQQPLITSKPPLHETICSPPRSRDPFANRPRFLFDPNSNPNDRHNSDANGFKTDHQSQGLTDNDLWNDINTEDSLDPNTLIGTLQLLKKLTNGIAIDPASGTIL